jgi:hypothetical protein
MSTINQQGGNTALNGGAFSPVRAATTGSNINLQTIGLGTIDGVALVAGDRVLVKDQSDQTQNGIYSASSGPWTRTSDAQTNTQFFQGMTVTAGPQGAVNAGQTFVCTTTDDPVVIGTSLLTFASQSAVQNAQQTAASTTSLTIGTGSKSLTIQAGKAFQTGQWVLIQETSTATNQMLGTVTSYSGTSLVVNVSATGGSGTHSDWTIVLTNSPAAAGFQPPTGTGNVTGPGSSTDGEIVLYSGTSGKVLKNSSVTLGPLASASSLTAQFLANSALGFAMGMVNGTVVTSEAGNALTVAVKTFAGATPSASDPVYILVPNGSGSYTVVTLTAALSITAPAGATFGTVNTQAGRQYLAVFETGDLGIYNCLDLTSLTSPKLVPWNETATTNTTAITSGSTSPQVWYATASLSSKRFRVIASLESTQTTAGQWAAPVAANLFGPGVKKPGDFAQAEVFSVISGSPTTSSASFVALSGANLSITPLSAANLIHARAVGSMDLGGNNNATITLSRGTAANTNLIGAPVRFNTTVGGVNAGAPSFIEADDLPNTTGPQPYAVQAKVTGSTLTYAASGSHSIGLREIQI